MITTHLKRAIGRLGTEDLTEVIALCSKRRVLLQKREAEQRLKDAWEWALTLKRDDTVWMKATYSLTLPKNKQCYVITVQPRKKLLWVKPHGETTMVWFSPAGVARFLTSVEPEVKAP